MSEIWKPHPKMPEYAISNIGRVKRFERTYIRCDGFKTTIKERLLNPGKNKDGYLRVRLKDRHVFVHQLVLQTFVGEKPNRNYQACHNNGVPDDNRVENLRWDEPKNNVRDRIRHGSYQIGERNHRNKYPDDLIISLGNAEGKAEEIAQHYNVEKSLVYYAKFRSKKQKGVFSPIYQIVGERRRGLTD